MPRLTLQFKNSPIALFNLEKGRSLKIGRNNDNDVIINNLAVSGHHAKIDSVGDGFVFIDLQSKNGSFVNEKFVNSHWLRDGDVINIGKHALVFSYTEEESRLDEHPSEMEKTMVMDTSQYRSMMEKSKPKTTAAFVTPEGQTRGYLTYLAGGDGNIRLRSQVTKIGKDPSSDIVVKGFIIGKTAATITHTADGYVLSWAGGFSKPRVNNQKVSKEPAFLKESDIIEIGSTRLQLVIKKVRKKPH